MERQKRQSRHSQSNQPSQYSQRSQQMPPQKPKRNLLNSAEIVLVKKDLQLIWKKPGQRALLMILPLVLVVGIPAVYFVAISLIPVEPYARLPEALLDLLPDYAAQLDYRQGWLVAFTQLLCPLLYLCVPILTAAASASYAFVNERESGTLESLLLTSMGAKSVFNAKITCCTLLSVLISAAGFLAFDVTVMVADLFADVPLFFSFDWLTLVVLEMPTLSLFSVVFVALIVNRVHSTGESLQTMGYLILPVAALYLVQFTGSLRVGWLVLVIIAAVLAVADIVLFNMAARSFTPEKLLAREGLE